MNQTKTRKLKRDTIGELIFPDPVPGNPEELLEMMNEASEHAGTAIGSGSVSFDHGTRIFNQLKAHYDLLMAREMGAAHLALSKATNDLVTATNALKRATWLLAAVTALLVVSEVWRQIMH